MSVTTPTGIFIINSTFFLPGWKLACCPAHVHKGIEVSFQTLISLPLQSGKSSELGPVKCLPLRVIHHPKWWYCAVKICLFSTSPPERSQKNTNDWINTYTEKLHINACESRCVRVWMKMPSSRATKVRLKYTTKAWYLCLMSNISTFSATPETEGQVL